MRLRDPGLGVALALAAASLLPFLGKAFHVDDPSFLWAARALSQDPWRPWSYVSVWAGSALPLHVHVNHPPGNAYLVWLGTLLFGESELGLHALFLGVALAAVLAIHAAARALTARPGLATLAAVASPAFLVTATGLMSDVPFLATWTAAVALWMRGQRRLASADAGERRRASRTLAGAALMAALCGFVRYNGIALVPLLAAYGVAARRRVSRELGWLVLPVLAFALYQVVFAIQYGHVAILTGATYAAEVKGNLGASAASLALVALIYLGGSLASLAILAPLAWSGRALAGSAAGALAAGGVFASGLGVKLGLPAAGADRAALVAQSALFAAAGALALALALADLRRRRSAESLLLLLWVLGTFAFASLLNWTVNVRSLLPAAPALAILLARRVGGEGEDAVAGAEAPLWSRGGAPAARPLLAPTPARQAVALAAALALALAVAAVDVAFANRARDGARQAAERARSEGRALFFAGRWGFQWYLEQEGAKPLDYAGTHIPAGAFVAQPDWARDLAPPPMHFSDVETLALGRPRWLATISHELAANFYAHAGYGPLPFAFGRATPGTVRLLEARREVDLRSPR